MLLWLRQVQIPMDCIGSAIRLAETSIFPNIAQKVIYILDPGFPDVTHDKTCIFSNNLSFEIDFFFDIALQSNVSACGVRCCHANNHVFPAMLSMYFHIF